MKHKQSPGQIAANRVLIKAMEDMTNAEFVSFVSVQMRNDNNSMLEYIADRLDMIAMVIEACEHVGNTPAE